MNFRYPPSMPPWPGSAPGANPSGQLGQAVSGSPGMPMNGQQALYLLALMGQLAQAAYQGQVPLPQAQPAGQPQQGAPQQAVQGEEGPSQGVQTQPVAAISQAQGVQPVSGVDFPDLPDGTRNRRYWSGKGLAAPGANNSLNPWTRGPMRPAWRR